MEKFEAHVKVLLQHLPEGTDKNHKNLRKTYPSAKF
jgi:hypothetical protein